VSKERESGSAAPHRARGATGRDPEERLGPRGRRAVAKNQRLPAFPIRGIGTQKPRKAAATLAGMAVPPARPRTQERGGSRSTFARGPERESREDARATRGRRDAHYAEDAGYNDRAARAWAFSIGGVVKEPEVESA
jgi:hypothetical protein